MTKLFRLLSILFAFIVCTSNIALARPEGPLESHEHWLVSAFEDGGLEIENGTNFAMRQSDIPVAMTWTKKSRILIFTFYSYRWWSTVSEYNYHYQLVNQATGETVLAKLTRKPFSSSPYNHRLIDLNSLTGEVVIASQGTPSPDEYDGDSLEYFQISPEMEDREEMKTWNKGDNIIIVNNGDFFRKGCHFALINASIKPVKVVRACKLPSRSN